MSLLLYVTFSVWSTIVEISILTKEETLLSLLFLDAIRLEPGEVGEGSVGFSHAVDFFLFLHRSTGVIKGVS